MEKLVSKILGFCMLIALFSVPAYAQFDDVYYDPEIDDPFYTSSTSTSSYYKKDTDKGGQYDNEYYDDGSYDNDSYSYYDDYDYYYTSRIRRFHKPYSGFGFYDPVYVDMYHYDPFYFSHNSWYPGTSIYISFGSPWSRWHRGSRWNRYHYWSSPIHRYYSYHYYGYPNYGWGGYHNSYGNNNYYYDYYNGYCPTPVGNYYGNYWGGNNNWGSNNNPGNSGNGVYYGPRNTGTVKSSPRGPVNSSGIGDNRPQGDNLVDRDKPSDGIVKEGGNVINRAPEGEKEKVPGTGYRQPEKAQSEPDRGDVKKDPAQSQGTRTQEGDRFSPTRDERPAYTPFNPSPRENTGTSQRERDNYRQPEQQRTYTPTRRSEPPRQYDTRREVPQKVDPYKRNNPRESTKPSVPQRSNDDNRRNYNPPSRERYQAPRQQSSPPRSDSSSRSSQAPSRSPSSDSGMSRSSSSSGRSSGMKSSSSSSNRSSGTSSRSGGSSSKRGGDN